MCYSWYSQDTKSVADDTSGKALISISCRDWIKMQADRIAKLILGSGKRIAELDSYAKSLPAPSNPLLQRIVLKDEQPYFMGDLHGQHAKYVRAIQFEVEDYYKSRIISVGDLVDRGAESFKCLDLTSKANFNSVLGNHESLWIDAIRKPTELSLSHLHRNGGESLIEAIFSETWREQVERIWHQLIKIPYAIELHWNSKVIGIVHAEPPCNWTWLKTRRLDETIKNTLLWDRSRFKYASPPAYDHGIENIDLVITGHTIQDTPTLSMNVLNIDTAAYMPEGKLTLLSGDEIFATYKAS